VETNVAFKENIVESSTVENDAVETGTFKVLTAESLL
jgi:hypothetical protein